MAHFAPLTPRQSFNSTLASLEVPSARGHHFPTFQYSLAARVPCRLGRLFHLSGERGTDRQADSRAVRFVCCAVAVHSPKRGVSTDKQWQLAESVKMNSSTDTSPNGPIERANPQTRPTSNFPDSRHSANLGAQLQEVLNAKKMVCNWEKHHLLTSSGEISCPTINSPPPSSLMSAST